MKIQKKEQKAMEMIESITLLKHELTEAKKKI